MIWENLVRTIPIRKVLFIFTTLVSIATCNSSGHEFKVSAPGKELQSQFQLDDFYEKAIVIDGFPIVASGKVSDAALIEAASTVKGMLSGRPDILRTLGSQRIRLSVMAVSERTTDIPEHSDLQPTAFWDKRARGLGATRARPSVSCGEENLLHHPGDPYADESILVHEFAHAVHLMAVNALDTTFDQRLEACFREAIQSGLWKGLYAADNSREYFAEAVQSWFGTNRQNDSLHNHVNTREELRAYDPGVAALCEEIFGDIQWQYVRSDDSSRLDEPHLKDLDREGLSTFRWSEAEISEYEEVATDGKLKSNESKNGGGQKDATQ